MRIARNCQDRQIYGSMRALLAAAVLLAAHSQVAAQNIPHSESRALPAAAKSAETADALSSQRGRMTPCTNGRAGYYACQGVDMLSRLSMSDYEAAYVNEVWGWTDPETGREYALAGRSDGVAFVDVTDHIEPVYVGDLLSNRDEVSVWRDMKVYKNHMFVVVDGAGHNGLQVFDLTQLRTFRERPLRFEATAHYDGIRQAHNVAINEASGFAYVTGALSGICFYGLHMVDIREPQNPVYAGCFKDTSTGGAGYPGYTHDAQCVMYSGPDSEHLGKEICFGSNVTALSVADVTNKENPAALGRASYPNAAYAHQGWLTEDHRHFIMNDELDEYGGLESFTRMLIWDVSDLDDPVFLAEYSGPATAIDHNLYVDGSKVFAANYTSGLRIIDIEDIGAPTEVAYFDTHPEDDGISFDGAWTAYPYFGSGTIVVSSFPHGLFVLAESGHEVYSGAAERKRDYAALVSLYNATGGAGWDDNAGWDPALAADRVTRWDMEGLYGVGMERASVASLDLARNSLTGALPAAIGTLLYLKELDIRGNALKGSLPRSLLQLRHLRELRFGGQALCAPSDDAFQEWLGSLRVADGPACPQVTFPAAGDVQDQSFVLGEPIAELAFPEAAGGAGPYSYAIAPALPAGLSFDAALRTLAGVPESLSATARYTYIATDANLESASMEFGIEVVAALQLPGAIEDQVFTRGEAIAELVLPEATGGSAPYAYTLAPELPSGLLFDASARVVSGAPDALTPGVLYTYAATDAAMRSDSLLFSIKIEAAALVLPDSIADQSFMQGMPIAELMLPEAAGGTPPYAYALTPTPPSGLVFDAAARTLSGTPVEALAPSVHTYKVTDAASVSMSLQFTIEVISTVASGDADALPEEFALQGNYPNPFTAATTVVFDLPAPADVTISVTNILGRRVLELEETGVTAGRGKTLEIDGRALPPGAYLYRIVARTAERSVVRTGSLLRVR